MTGPRRCVLICLLALPLFWLAGSLVPAPDAQVGVATLHAQATPGASHMKEHFDKVEIIQEAILRGDLESVREPAKWLFEHKAEGMPEKAATQILAMQAAARRALDATDIKAAANAMAVMASTCGTCHRSTDVTPKLPEPPAIQGSGVAGHMLAHQRAVDYMYQGLAAPSDRLWVQGADMLKGAPLKKEELPNDPKLTEEIKAYESQVHQIAERARKANDPKTRVAVYSEVIAGCAECHSLHGRAWGPGVPK